MRKRTTAIMLALAASISGCGFGNCGAPKVEAAQAADRALVALKAGDFAAASSALETGRASSELGGESGLRTMVESQSLQPASWTWARPEYKSRRQAGGDESSYVEVAAEVQFADGSSGRAVATMEALGCQPDPWRIDAFRLERSGP